MQTVKALIRLHECTGLSLPSLSEYSQRHCGSIYFQQLTMTTELTANYGNKLLDGKTEITYCEENKKKITVEYSIEQSSDDSLRLVLYLRLDMAN